MNQMMKMIFSGTVFDETDVFEQKYPFEYITILYGLNFNTKVMISVYEKLGDMANGKRSMWDTDTE